MLSANTLFHFTPKLDTLCKILNSGFRPSYCRERFMDTGDDCHIPMVCFCDIPLSQVHGHVSRYGKYGLGMNVEWGIQNRVNPVTYVSKKSSIYGNITSMQDGFIFELGMNKIEGTVSVDPMGQGEAILRLSPYLYFTTELQCYLKAYKGVDTSSGLVTKFYDEKEWRYLPPSSLFPKRNPLFLRIPSAVQVKTRQDEMRLKLSESFLEMSLGQALEEGKSRVNNHFLIFKPEHIKYIIVAYENDKADLLDSLSKNTGIYPPAILERLSSRILTYHQIKDDF